MRGVIVATQSIDSPSPSDPTASGAGAVPGSTTTMRPASTSNSASARAVEGLVTITPCAWTSARRSLSKSRRRRSASSPVSSASG